MLYWKILHMGHIFTKNLFKLIFSERKSCSVVENDAKVSMITLGQNASKFYH